MSKTPSRLALWLTLGVIANSAYLFLVDAASLFYIGNVVGHLVLGVGAAVVWLFAGKGWPARLTAVGAVFTIVSGVLLAKMGNLIPNRPILWTHIGFATAASAAALWWLSSALPKQRRLVLGMAAATVAALLIVPQLPSPTQDVITNPLLPPATMAGEAMGGEDGPFFPSAVKTVSGDLIPPEFFLESQTCGRVGCHQDATAQWNGSAHHFSSFNNQWYRKSIEYMQDVAGLQRPQWCAGCHDHALLFSGQMAQPVEDFVDTPAAQAGLACVSCHAIKEVGSTMGNGDFTLEFPPLHDLATSDNPVLRTVHDILLELDPAPHRETFLRPFMREQPSEFCSSCHKVHLDEPVNDYRWLRGFNTYDNWQASGVSGMGARSFYEPPEPKNCVTCHMPAVPSDEPASKGGYLKAHHFPAANTAVPTANGDSTQLAATEAFLKADQIRIEVFAAGEPAEVVREQSAPDAMGQQATTFAVGMEAGDMAAGLTAAARAVRAPLRDGAAVLQRGREVRLDVVVRTMGLGHFFPSGTVDAQEAWIELKAETPDGRVLLWSGGRDEAGRVDPSAHYYRNWMVDARGNHLDKRNAFASRAVVYVNLIPPGAADVAHYRLFVPDDVTGEVQVSAQLHYRKFTWQYTHFSFRGETNDDADKAVGYDDRIWTLADQVLDVTGDVEEVPDPPIVTMARDEVTLRIADELEQPVSTSEDRGWWNDYGIALLRQGDLKSAEQAFRRVVELDPGYADGWVNLARVYVAEGDLEPAAEVLAEALAVRPEFHKALYFRGLYWKALGEYQNARADLTSVAERFPKDRVVQNQLGRVNYLDSELEQAVEAFERVLRIDPEDLMAHYNLMLVYRALGNAERAEQHEIRYLRFKDDEASQSIARAARAENAYINNEAQPIHDHGSAPTGFGGGR
ncbi:MAG: tetratricopeptide repeat protein [Rhodothermales bacterium]|nr:tetratricopeptide repeat protein [Rhodothermales bacterium]MBO6780075.1 tetratricopeptide repeat protein [Rhodothermales bacterium]